MKKSVLKSLLFSVLGMFVFSSVQAEERVVATVDGFPVLESQVRAAMGKKGDHQAALDKVIDDILVQKAIQESGIKINPKELDLIVEDIAAKNGLTYGQFLDALDYQGISLKAFTQQIANQMIMSGVRDHAISNSVQITREEVDELGKKMLKEAKANGTEKKVTGKEYEVRHILLKLNPLLNDAQAKSELTQIRADIISGKMTFADAALKYSKDYLSGANGGSLGYAFPEAYVAPFAKAVQTTKQGVISAPFKSEFGWHILEVIGIRDGDRTEDAYRQKAYEKIVNSQLQDATKDWVKVLRKTADIQYFNK
ncbi:MULTISPECIES: peptidylprolyl isomerase [Rodentibacter]|uniref:peptidylprolyl isomerase n=1 Tax=Rodentibacter TaxID=1960084 RepID=UPI001CFD194B|nr:peptidylprolyl isomerase [Rodentibacter sp. JRC1]GJI55851.1 putative peptidyl-prolyl cis-trans isomerase SurA [Rodentibacter sp. JRC1]